MWIKIDKYRNFNYKTNLLPLSYFEFSKTCIHKKKWYLLNLINFCLKKKSDICTCFLAVEQGFWKKKKKDHWDIHSGWTISFENDWRKAR